MSIEVTNKEGVDIVVQELFNVRDDVIRGAVMGHINREKSQRGEEPDNKREIPTALINWRKGGVASVAFKLFLRQIAVHPFSNKDSAA